MALAAQKNNCPDPNLTAWFRARLKAAGKRLEIGKCCVRLPAIGRLVAETSVEKYIEHYESSRKR